MPIQIRRIVIPPSVKSAALRSVTGSLVEVYLGRDAGQRVLSGRIERGKVESIHTVIWFSDMRNYTALSEAMASDELITMLDDYAEAVITSVHAHGGDVLKLIGDGVLAIFNQSDAAEAAAASLASWEDLARRLGHLNKRRKSDGKLVTTIHVGLHVGQVFYGNVGSDE